MGGVHEHDAGDVAPEKLWVVRGKGLDRHTPDAVADENRRAVAGMAQHRSQVLGHIGELDGARAFDFGFAEAAMVPNDDTETFRQLALGIESDGAVQRPSMGQNDRRRLGWAESFNIQRGTFRTGKMLSAAPLRTRRITIRTCKQPKDDRPS